MQDVVRILSEMTERVLDEDTKQQMWVAGLSATKRFDPSKGELKPFLRTTVWAEAKKAKSRNKFLSSDYEHAVDSTQESEMAVREMTDAIVAAGCEDIVSRLVSGHKVKDIASELGVSPRTVLRRLRKVEHA